MTDLWHWLALAGCIVCVLLCGRYLARVRRAIADALKAEGRR